MSSPSSAYPRGPYKAANLKYAYPTQDQNIARSARQSAPALGYKYSYKWLDFRYWQTHYARIKHEALHPQLVSRLRKRIFSTVTALLLIWVVALYYGERYTFKQSIEACHWSTWEVWPSAASPHHVIFIADPQLVDPHTYPGRPWPISSLTVTYTDLYLRRSYSLLREALRPDTIFFLGDLFDGGREWSTSRSDSPEEQWRRYGESFWLREYNRFGSIFFKHRSGGSSDDGFVQQGTRILASLPGNHDLGFGTGIQKPVRDRFIAYFGEPNRINIVGNHTFVSLDTVSLSARGAGSAGNTQIWQPTVDFLEGIQSSILKSTIVDLSSRKGLVPHSRQPHIVKHVSEPPGQGSRILSQFNISFPTVLLTHVPLYRSPGTPCGPLREHWPPSSPPLEVDDRNAISVSGGYQYQNVLTPEITKDIIEKIGRVDHVFSGDDHDYCEILHRGYRSAVESIREITVKSMSWAMGVRKPGFQMLSLWNPIDEEGNVIVNNNAGDGSPDATRTMQSHLCLLPDQLGIFIRYVMLLGITLAILALRSIIVSLRSASQDEKSSPLLPIVRGGTDEKTDDGYAPRPDAATNSATRSNHDTLTTRIPHARGMPSEGINGVASDRKAPQYQDIDTEWEPVYVTGRRPTARFRAIIGDFKRSVWRVAWIVLLWYAWLLRNG